MGPPDESCISATMTTASADRLASPSVNAPSVYMCHLRTASCLVGQSCNAIEAVELMSSSGKLMVTGMGPAWSNASVNDNSLKTGQQNCRC